MCESSQAQFYFNLAESQHKTLCEVIGIAKHDTMSENELEWWRIRSFKRPFVNDQINFGQGQRWCYDDPMDIKDPDKAAEIKKQIEELKRQNNG